MWCYVCFGCLLIKFFCHLPMGVSPFQNRGRKGEVASAEPPDREAFTFYADQTYNLASGCRSRVRCLYRLFLRCLIG